MYRQPEGFVETATNLVGASSSIQNFNFTSFAMSTGLGEPLAGTFFLTSGANATAHTLIDRQSALNGAGLVPLLFPYATQTESILDLAFPQSSGSNFLASPGESLGMDCMSLIPFYFDSANFRLCSARQPTTLPAQLPANEQRIVCWARVCACYSSRHSGSNASWSDVYGRTCDACTGSDPELAN
jgi:hypothetical protein